MAPRPWWSLLSAALLLDACRLAAGPRMEGAVGWSDIHPQTELLDAGVKLTVVPTAASESPARSGGGLAPFQTAVDAESWPALAGALWATGLLVGGRFLLVQQEDPECSGGLGWWVLRLVGLGASASVSLGLGSLFLLLAADVSL